MRVKRDAKEPVVARFERGQLVVTSSPSGALVMNDLGEELGKTPLSIAVPIGTRDYFIELTGYKPQDSEFNINTQSESKKHFTLEKKEVVQNKTKSKKSSLGQDDPGLIESYHKLTF